MQKKTKKDTEKKHLHHQYYYGKNVRVSKTTKDDDDTKACNHKLYLRVHLDYGHVFKCLTQMKTK